MRYFIDISYHGKPYFGFQKQPDVISVQEVVENALGVCFQKPKAIVGAGRTDTGVHAKQLIAHFDTEDYIDIPQCVYKLNSLLPESISVNSIYQVNNLAHARFDASARAYQYVITTHKNPFLIDEAHYIIKPLDIEAMNNAAKLLLDYTNFECFSKVKTDVKTFTCNIEYAMWTQHNHKLIFTIKADRFLRNMVRAIVGTLLDIGLHKRTVESMHAVILSKNRSMAGTSVPAKGLYLTTVEYPEYVKDINTPIVREFKKNRL